MNQNLSLPLDEVSHAVSQINSLSKIHTPHEGSARQTGKDQGGGTHQIISSLCG